MSRQAGLLLKRRQILAFIREDPAVLQLRRPTETDDGAGGRTRQTLAVGAFRTYRLVPAARAHGMTREASGSRISDADWVLVGTHDSDVQVDDEFEVNGRWFRVTAVDQDKSYRVAAAAVEHGVP